MTLHNMFGALALDDTLTDGTQKSQIVDAGGVGVDVTPANALKVDNSGVTQVVTGDVSHDAVDSGPPIKVGAKAATALHSITPVAGDDRTDLHAGVDGVLIVREHSNLESTQSGVTSMTAPTEVAMSGFAAPGAGLRWYITDIIVHNQSSYGTAVEVKSGVGGTVQAILPAPARGGMVHRFAVPLKIEANTSVVLNMSGLANPVHVTMCGFKSKI